MLLELSRPFSYLSIDHPGQLPKFVNWWLPIALAGACVFVGYKLPEPIDVFGSSGLLAKILGFVQSLPGFYLAALAAVATFNAPDLDKLMPGTPPTARVIYNGALTKVQLSRRRMLCILFAFLTVESFMLTLAAISATTLAEPIKNLLPSESQGLVKMFGTFAYLLFLWQMLTVTLWGLYYVGERIHTPDR